MSKLFVDKKYKGWKLKTETSTFADFTFQTLKNQLPSVEGGGFPSFRITPPEPVGSCNYLDVRKGPGKTYFLRFNILMHDGTREKYHSETVDEENLVKMLHGIMDRGILPYVNRWTIEQSEN